VDPNYFSGQPPAVRKWGFHYPKYNYSNAAIYRTGLKQGERRQWVFVQSVFVINDGNSGKINGFH
jgi:hypothetical protein